MTDALVLSANAVDRWNEKQWRRQLDDNGYVVIKQVISPSEIDVLIDTFYDDLAKLQTGIDRNDINTFINRHWFGIFSVGIAKNPATGLGMGRFQWTVRSKVAAFFRVLLDEDDIITSFDGLGAFRNHHLPALRNTKTKPPWIHVDQGLQNGTGHTCYQGMVNFLPADLTTGGLVVAPGSHQHFKRVIGTSQKPQGNYQPLDVTNDVIQEVIAECGGMQMVAAGPGDLILWDSRLIHSNSPSVTPSSSLSPLLRIVSYVCFMPRPDITTQVGWETAAFRQQAVEVGALCNHWPVAPSIKCEHLAYPRHKSLLPITGSAALSAETINAEYKDIV
jgi:ectoine hydroxylase-related dioxygenase (phytanoyl-CoA dioxygenase family)